LQKVAKEGFTMLFRLGLIAIVLSVVPWLAIAGAPLLGLSLSAGAGLVAGALVVAEVLFWVGLALAGKDTWQTIKARGWRRAPRKLARLLVQGRSIAPRSAAAQRPVCRCSRTRHGTC
jgi:hypothetical protein